MLNKVSPKKIKLLDTNLESIMPNLTNGRVILKLKSSVSVEKNSSLLHSHSVLSIAYEFNNFTRNSLAIILHLKSIYFVESNW